MHTAAGRATGLREVTAARRVEGDRLRRWFTDPDVDLTVWYDRFGRPVAFQLGYSRGGIPRAFTWERDGHDRHERVDDGEGRPGRYKQAPLLVPDGAVPRVHLLRLVRERAGTLEPELRELTLSVLRGER